MRATTGTEVKRHNFPANLVIDSDITKKRLAIIQKLIGQGRCRRRPAKV